MATFFDVALVFDAAARSADIALTADGDLAIDETPVTPMLISLFSDRRARQDDELPDAIADLNRPTTFIARRGWVGDALARDGQRTGSRLWLLNREKQTELTRRRAEIYAAEALDWADAETGRAAEIAAQWIRPSVLALRCAIDGTPLTVTSRVVD